MSSSNITNDNFINTSSPNLDEKKSSSDNIAECKPIPRDINAKINEIPEIPIDRRNVNLVGNENTSTFRVETGENWKKETKTSYGSNNSKTEVTYIYSYDGFGDEFDINDDMNIFSNNNFNIFFDFFNNTDLPNLFNNLSIDNDPQQLESAFEAFSINKNEFDNLTKEKQEQQIKSAYHQAARKYHPDKNTNDKDATAKFQELDKHKKILLDYIAQTSFI